MHLWQWNLEWISPRLPCCFIQCVWSAKFDLNLPCCLFCVSLLQNDWTEASEILEWSFQAAIKVVIDSWNLTPWVEALSHNSFNSNVQTVTTQLVLLWQQYKSLLFRKQTRENSPNVRITSGNSTTNPFFPEIKHENLKNLHASVTFFFFLNCRYGAGR